MPTKVKRQRNRHRRTLPLPTVTFADDVPCPAENDLRAFLLAFSETLQAALVEQLRGTRRRKPRVMCVFSRAYLECVCVAIEEELTRS